MDDLGNLSQCIVGSDSHDRSRARRLRGGALAASTLLEGAVVAAMLLWPLLAPSVLPSRSILAPVPIFHTAPHVVTEPRPEPQPRASDSPIFSVPILQQPPRIPQHVSSTSSGEPQIPDGSFSSDRQGFGWDFVGVGNDGLNIARPAGNGGAKGPVSVSGGVMNARLIHRVEPLYPPAAIVMRLEGTVQLRAIIGTDGAVRNIEVVNGNPILAKAAVAAVEQWRYQPTQLSGKPVEVETIVTVQFQMVK